MNDEEILILYAKWETKCPKYELCYDLTKRKCELVFREDRHESGQTIEYFSIINNYKSN